MHLPDVCVIIGPRKVDEVSVLKICYVTFLHQNIYIFFLNPTFVITTGLIKVTVRLKWVPVLPGESERE